MRGNEYGRSATTMRGERSSAEDLHRSVGGACRSHSHTELRATWTGVSGSTGNDAASPDKMRRRENRAASASRGTWVLRFERRCIISRMFKCPACGQPTLHFQNTIQRGTLIDRRIRCDSCGYNRPISWQEKRSLLVQIGIAKGQRKAKPRGERNAGAGGC